MPFLLENGQESAIMPVESSKNACYPVLGYPVSFPWIINIFIRISDLRGSTILVFQAMWEVHMLSRKQTFNRVWNICACLLVVLFLVSPGTAFVLAQTGSNTTDGGEAPAFEPTQAPQPVFVEGGDLTDPPDKEAAAESDLSGVEPATVEMLAGSLPYAHGILYFSQDSNANGLYRLNVTTGAGTLVGAGATSVNGSTVGLSEGPNQDLLYGSKPSGILHIAADGSGATTLGAEVMEALAYNPRNGVTYAALNGVFFTVNTATGTKINNLAAPGFDVEGLAADPMNNVIYGIGDGTNLVKFDVGLGSWSVVGNTGLTWDNAGLAYDPIGGYLYAVSTTTGANLYLINPATAVPSLVGPTGIAGSSSGGLAFVPAPLTYVAATWNDDRIHFLDNRMRDLGSVPAGAADPNGIATTGDQIYTGHFSTNQVIMRDIFGTEQLRWTGVLSSLQGMEIVDGQLAVYLGSGTTIQFHDAFSGRIVRSIPGAISVEGLAYDGTLLWQLGDSTLVGTNPASGAVVRSIPNAASGCAFAGTGIAAFPPGQLTLACENGQWYRVSAADGSVLASGNNGLNMYDLARVPPAYVAATWGDNAVHMLDRNLIDVGSYPAGATSPNGIATDALRVWTGHFSPQQVRATNYNGDALFQWSGTLSGLQGMDLVNTQLGIYRSGPNTIEFFNPVTGALQRSIPGASSTEGLAFDGSLLWMLADNLVGVNPATGAVVRTLPNAASGCAFGGTGLADLPPNYLVLACADGRWFIVETTAGSVVLKGYNGLQMYGLDRNPYVKLGRVYLPQIRK